MSDKVYLITGGASLVGSHLADHLLKMGASEVRLLDNFALGSTSTIQHLVDDKRVRLIRGDILRLNGLIDAATGAEGIFALAGFLTLPLSQNLPLGVEVNAMGMVNTLEAARLAKVRRVVFSSSISVYGNTAADLMSEDVGFRTHELPPASAIYSASKLLGESMARFYALKHGVETNSLRFSSVYGERQHRRAVNAVFLAEAYEKIRKNLPPVIVGDGSEVHDYIHVRDVATACYAAMTAPAFGEVFNVVTGIDTSLNTAVDLLLKISGKKTLKPLRQADTREVRSSSVDKLNLDPSKAERLLGWRSEVSLEEGLRSYIAWRESDEAAHVA